MVFLSLCLLELSERISHPSDFSADLSITFMLDAVYFDQSILTSNA